METFKIEKLKEKYFKNFSDEKKKKNCSEIWLKACEIAKVTDSQPNRWLKLVKIDPWATDRSLIDLKEKKDIDTPVFYFLWLFKNYHHFGSLNNNNQINNR